MIRKSPRLMVFIAACLALPEAAQLQVAIKQRSLLPALSMPEAHAEPLRVLPVKNTIAITPDNFCKGLPNVFAITKQNIKEQTDILCPGGVPSATFTSLITNAYRGTGTPTLTTIRVVEDQAAVTSEILVAYALRVPKNAVKTLLGEEQHVVVPYQGENLNISAKFLPPPLNLGEADTAFTIEQRTVVRDNVSFDDTSIHDLRMYPLYPNNFDFFMAARTLQKPSEQFKKSVVLRAVLGDATDPNSAYSVTLLHFVMNSREEHERVVEAFTNFITADMRVLYTNNSRP